MKPIKIIYGNREINFIGDVMIEDKSECEFKEVDFANIGLKNILIGKKIKYVFTCEGFEYTIKKVTLYNKIIAMIKKS